MSTTKSHLRINHDLLNNFFFIKVKGGTAELRYDRQGDELIDLLSTNVPPESREFGIGRQLVESALEYADEQNLKVKPSCSFAESYIEDHPEWKRLLI